MTTTGHYWWPDGRDKADAYYCCPALLETMPGSVSPQDGYLPYVPLPVLRGVVNGAEYQTSRLAPVSTK